MTSASLQANRFAFLDLLRAIAALSVIVQHLLESVYPDFGTWSQQNVNPGIFGVTLFFLVSGYIIPASLDRGNLASFWIARVFRLYPLYWFSIALAILFGQWGYLKPLSHGEIIVNLSMIQEFVRVPHLMGLYWTLSMELLFYILCSLAFLAPQWWRSQRLPYLAILGLAIATLYCYFTKANIPLGRLQMIVAAFVGMYAYRIDQRNSFEIRPMLLTLIPTLIAAAYTRFGDLVPARVSGEPNFSFVCVIISWLSAYLTFYIAIQVRNRIHQSILTTPGLMCYSLYLMHPFVLMLTPTNLPPIARILLVLMGSGGISWVCWKTIEQPFIQIGKRIKQRFYPPQMHRPESSM